MIFIITKSQNAKIILSQILLKIDDNFVGKLES